jgi:two-component system response regulator LytT
MIAALSALAVDDEAPALDELSYLLRHCPLVERVETATNADDALRCLQRQQTDVVLADIRMPGLDGLELASILGAFAAPPAVVFVTAHQSHAVDAFEVGAAGYLLKPLDAERLSGVLRRVAAQRLEHPEHAGSGNLARTSSGAGELDTLVVETPGRTALVSRAEVAWVEAAGDYVRLHTGTGDPHGALVRIPIGALEEAWSGQGFVRIHRSYLVSLAAVRELRSDGPHTEVLVGGRLLPVSRRQVRALRERLVSRGRR